MIDEMAPVANEKEMTPMSISNMQRSFSARLLAVISPYPTVMMVVTVK
jgi:hypothetical protein